VTAEFYRNSWEVIFNSLNDRKIEYEVSFIQRIKIGNYVGLDSARHNLSRGDEMLGSALVVRLK